MTQTESALRINLGAGPTEIPGYTNWDRKNGHEAYPLDVPDNSVDEIRASHLLEHFDYRQTLDVLKDWWRALKPGGVLKVAVPDVDWWVKTYTGGGHPQLEGIMFGGHVDGDDFHHALFNDGKLRELLRMAGFVRTRPWATDGLDTSAHECSLNIQANKPRRGTPPPAALVMSLPRLGFQETTACMMASVNGIGLPNSHVILRQGVFWGQTMTAAIRQTLALPNVKYIYTVDYDSVFTAAQMMELYYLAEDYPEADAICGTQVGRDRDTVLMTIRGSDGKNKPGVLRSEVESDLLKVNTAHFGLTILRAEKFATLKKPWFLHHPDENGEWEEGRIDEDIHFWRNWEACGNTVYQANNVRLGHMQQMITWPNDELQPVHQYLGDYRKHGPPVCPLS